MGTCFSRVGWIAGCLLYAGRFGSEEKKVLMEAFEVSEPTISRDQMRLWRLLRDVEAVAMEKGKLVVRDQASFDLPADLPVPSLDDWLEVMMGKRYAQVIGPERVAPQSAILRDVIKAIRERKALSILYVSRSAPDQARWRPVSPHALIKAFGRYHALCWDHEVGEDRDFVLTRILATTFSRSDASVYVASDRTGTWLSETKLEVTVADGQSLDIARLDYGLDETGRRLFHVRKALAPYLVSRKSKGFEDLVVISKVPEKI